MSSERVDSVRPQPGRIQTGQSVSGAFPTVHTTEVHLRELTVLPIIMGTFLGRCWRLVLYCVLKVGLNGQRVNSVP